jgi:pyruvate/2-oxoglutarate dehydrogenase complex dihydrolipoamide acyltransferase (E2) component
MAEEEPKEEAAKKSGVGCLVLLAIVGIVVLFGALAGDDEPEPRQAQPAGRDQKEDPPPPTSAPAPSPPTTQGPDRDSGLACRHFRNIVGDADVLSDAEIREKLKEVHDDANIATPAVQTAAREALAAVTSGTTEEFGAAIRSLSEACAAAGW